MADANRLAAALRYQQDMEGPVTMNPNIAEQGRKGRANMVPPTSVMDPRSRDYERRSRETENFLIGADILAGALPFAPLAKGAVMAAGRYATPKVMQGMENYMGRTGMTLNAAPQDEALRLAQQRAALPVEQHGLGLPAGNTPMDRANVMFPVDAYHGTNVDVSVLNPELAGTSGMARSGKTHGVWATDNMKNANRYTNASPEILKKYSDYVNRMSGNELSVNEYNSLLDLYRAESGSVVYPLKLNTTEFVLKEGKGRVTTNREFAKEVGKNKDVSGGTIFNTRDLTPDSDAFTHYFIKNPDNIRSRFAAFDPFRRNAALAAALGVAAPDLLAEET